MFSRESKSVPRVITPHRSIESPIPAPGTKEILERLDAVEARSMHNQLPIVWAGAENYSVWDIAQNKFIDFTSGIFVSSVGHGNIAVSRDLENLFLHSYTFATCTRVEYLEKLTAWSGFEKAMLFSSGTEATEAALKIMRLYGEKTGKTFPGVVACLKGAFHGKTMGARLMSDNERPRDEFCDPHIRHISVPPETEPDALVYFFQQCLGELCNNSVDPDRDVCGIMVETFRGWDAHFYPPRFVEAIALFCRQRKALLCFDEMQAGFGRTGRKFGYEHYGVKPDLICVGKGMGGGFPVSGVLGRAELLDLPEDMSSTHSANPLACAAGLAVIEEIERLNLVEEAKRKGQMLVTEFDKLMARCPVNIHHISGEGLIWAVVFKDPDGTEFAAKVAERCMEKGLLVVYTGRESVKIGPPLTIPYDALREGVEVLGEAIMEISAG